MSLRAQLDAAATLLDEGAASSAVRMLRSSWEPELPANDLVPLYCMWVRALCETGDYDHALTLSVRAAEEFPREPDVLIALGNVFDLRGDLDSAREAFARAIESDRAGALQRYNLGAVLERLGDERGAERCYRESIEVESDGATLFEANAALGALLRRTGRVFEASEVYEGYLDEDPLNVDVLVELGICLSDLDEYEDAVDRFQVALSLDGDHAGAWYNLAITQWRMGRQDDAFASMNRAHECDRGSPLTLAVLGSWVMAQDAGDLDRALGLLYGALDRLNELALRTINVGYASLVCEEVFEALWQRRRHAEAREVARMAGQRDWITAHMLETLAEADNGRADRVTAFTVTARAVSGETLEHWPADAQGFTTGLRVLASDEEEARRYSLEYLRSLEPYPTVQFQIETVRPVGPTELMDIGLSPRARGVVGVANARSYFRGCQ
jgi:tetratricopeptide (TPR) repeat protein